MRSTKKYAMLSSFQISGRTSGLAAALILLLLAGVVGERSNASITADRFGGFEDCYSIGEGAGRAAPGISRAYEALVVAQVLQTPRRGGDSPNDRWFPPTDEERARWSREYERDYQRFEEWMERRGQEPLTISEFRNILESLRQFEEEQTRRSREDRERRSYAMEEWRERVRGMILTRSDFKEAIPYCRGSAKREYDERVERTFDVPWGGWYPTGIAIRKGDGFQVKATGAYVSTNKNSDVKTCGPDGCGHWKWFGLKAKIGSQLIDVGASGGGTAAADGFIELGSPRGREFLKEDAGNCTGTLSVEVWITPRR